MKTNPLLLIALPLTVVVSGCSRVDSVSRYGITATLIDKTSGRPLSKHPVRVTVDHSGFELLSTRKGRIQTPSVKQAYWTWLGGPIHASREEAKIRIQSQGYQDRTFDWSRHSNGLPFTEHRGCLDLGTLELQPHQARSPR